MKKQSPNNHFNFIVAKKTLCRALFDFDWLNAFRIARMILTGSSNV
jgi:hypothetical protein